MDEPRLPSCVRKLYIRNDRAIGDKDTDGNAGLIQYRVNGWGGNFLEFPLDAEPLVRAVQVQRLTEMETFMAHVYRGGIYEGMSHLQKEFRKLMCVAPSGSCP